jgi:hypothetical protein
MYSAILIACLIAAPQQCQTHEFALVATMPVPLAIEAQERAAEWLDQHRGMAVRSLTVLPGRGA